MILCSDGHDEVCFEERSRGNLYGCPACEAIKQCDEVKQELKEAKARIDDYESLVKILKGQIDAQT